MSRVLRDISVFQHFSAFHSTAGSGASLGEAKDNSPPARAVGLRAKVAKVAVIFFLMNLQLCLCPVLAAVRPSPRPP